MLIKYQNCFKDDEFQFAKVLIFWTKYLKKIDIKPGKIGKYGSDFDIVENIIYDICPHPYYG